MSNPELSGIARMTHVVPPLQQMGRLTAECTATLSSGAHPREVIRVRKRLVSPTFLACSAATLVIVGAAVGLSSNVGASFENLPYEVPSFHLVGSKLYAAVAAPKVAVGHDEVSEDGAGHALDAVKPSAPVEAGPAEIQVIAAAHETPNLAPLSAGLTHDDRTTPAATTITADKNEPKLIKPLYVAVVSGLPAGSRISMGTQLSKNEWVLALDDLNKAQVSTPKDLRKPIRARVEISDGEGGALVKFPLAISAQGRIDTDAVASAAGTPDRAVSPRPAKAAKSEQSPPPKAPKGQKAGSVTEAPKRNVSPVALVPTQRLGLQIFPLQIIRDNAVPPQMIMPSEEDDPVTTPVRTLGAGTAGLVTFKTFTNRSAQ